MNFAAVHKPTLSERFWRALGFRYHLGEDPEGVDSLEGWTRTDMRLEFSIADRCRLLMTGRLFIAYISHYNAPAPSIVKSRMDWQIRAPGEPR